MKNIKKIILFLLITIAFTTKVYAGSVCDIKVIEEDPINWDAGFKVKLPVCNFKDYIPDGWTTVSNFDKEKDTPADAYSHGTDLKTYTKWVESIDAKSVYETKGKIPVCYDEKRTVKAKANCVAKIDAKESSKYQAGTGAKFGSEQEAKNNCKGGYFQDNGGWACRIHYCANSSHTRVGETNYCCPSGYGDLEDDNKHCCPSGYEYESATGKCVKKFDGQTLNFAYGTEHYDNRTDTNNSHAEDYFKKTIKSNENISGLDVTCDSFKYQLLCPTYNCEIEYPNVKACTPTFKANGDSDAYCINPNMGFNSSSEKNYLVDDSFDVDSCTDSFINANCGYANILIEGAYHKVDNKAMNLALRLWAYHRGQIGFDDLKTGIANVISEEGKTNCSKRIYFRKTATGYGNVYQHTYRQIFEEYEKLARSNINIVSNLYKNIGLPLKVNGEVLFKEIVCDNQKTSHVFSALACEGITSVSYDLFFNTLIGNKNMKKHLAELRGNGSGTGIIPKPTGASLIDGENNCGPKKNQPCNKQILVSYDPEIIEEVFGEYKEIDCVQFNKDPGTVLQFCNEKSDRYRKEDCESAKSKLKLFCEEKIYFDEDDPVGHTPSKCINKQKGCVYDTEITAVCKENYSKTLIKEVYVEYTPGEEGVTVKKLIPCDNPTKNQNMFIYWKEPGKDGGETTTRKRRIEVYNSFDCKDTCTNTDIQIEASNCSSDDSGYNYGTTQKAIKSSVKDPTLACIASASDNVKASYDYSKEFGVNTNFCRIYCADEAEYYLPDKTYVKSGTTFDYNLVGDSTFFAKVKNENLKLTAVVKQTRRCISEIYYDKPSPEARNWRQLYNTDEVYSKIPKDAKLPSDFKNPPETWKNLFDLYRFGDGTRESLNGLLYHLFNCNLYNSVRFEDPTVNARYNWVYKPDPYSYNNVYDRIIELYSKSNNYNLKDVTKFKDSLTYKFGPYISTYTEGNANNNSSENVSDKRVGDPSVEIKPINSGDYGFNLSSSSIKGIDDKQKINNFINQGKLHVLYCTDNLNSKSDYDHPDKACFDQSKFQYKDAKGDPVDVFEYFKNYNYFDTFSLAGGTTIIPKNDYAYFDISVEANFFNNNVYQVLNDTGNVVIGKKSDKLLTLDDYTYPSSKNAYNINGAIDGVNPIKIENDKNENRVLQPIKQTIEISTFNRNLESDLFTQTLNKKEYMCYVKTTPPPTVNIPNNPNFKVKTRIRNVDLGNLFPNSGYEQLENTPWKTKYGLEVKKEIETSNNDLKTSDKYLEYSITLSPDQIRNIKEYNKNKAYIDSPTGNCSVDSNNGIYVDCKSDFLNLMRSSDGSDATKYGTYNKDYDGVSKYTNDKKSNNNN